VRHDDARQERSERHWQHQAAEDGMRFGGLLLDLFERGLPARLVTTGGRIHSGLISAVGSDFCAITAPERSTVLVSLTTISAVQLEGAPRSFPGASDRNVGEEPQRLEHVLGELATSRSPLRFAVNGSAELRSGELTAIGQDVAVFAMGRPATTTLFVPLGHLSEISLAD